MGEYDRTDAAFYDSYSTGTDGDLSFYVEEARRAGSPVLELGCGTGRILIPTAEAGLTVTGLDRAPSMLAVARQKIARLDAATQGRITLVEGDMRAFALGQRFNLITIPYRAFLHLLTVEDERRALGCIREHLVDGGRLVLNIFDPRLDVIVIQQGLVGTSQKKMDEFVHPQTGRRVVIWDTIQYDLERQMLEDERIFEEVDGEGKMVSRTYNLLTLRFIYRYEMQHLLELCGFQVEALYGDFRRSPFRAGGEQVWVARRS
jgi:ubiquinone/menaquinone biosynthesis C-methylase UbiE